MFTLKDGSRSQGQSVSFVFKCFQPGNVLGLGVGLGLGMGWVKLIHGQI